MQEVNRPKNPRRQPCSVQARPPRSLAVALGSLLLAAFAVLSGHPTQAAEQTQGREVQIIDLLSRSICTCLVNDAIKNGSAPTAISEAALKSGIANCSPETRMRQILEGGAPPSITDADIGDGSADTIRKWSPVVAGCSKSMFDASLADFKIRSAVTNALIAARPIQACVLAHYRARQALAMAAAECSDEKAAAGQASGVATISLEKSGAIAISFGAGMGRAEGKTITLAAERDSSGKLLWSCTGGDLEALYRPASCR